MTSKRTQNLAPIIALLPLACLLLVHCGPSVPSTFKTRQAPGLGQVGRPTSPDRPDSGRAPVLSLSYSEDRVTPEIWRTRYAALVQAGLTFDLEAKGLDALNVGGTIELTLSTRTRQQDPLDINLVLSSTDAGDAALPVSDAEKVSLLEASATNSADDGAGQPHWLEISATATPGKWLLRWNALGPYGPILGADAMGGAGPTPPRLPKRPKLEAVKLIFGKPVALD